MKANEQNLFPISFHSTLRNGFGKSYNKLTVYTEAKEFPVAYILGGSRIQQETIVTITNSLRVVLSVHFPDTVVTDLTRH